MITGGAAGFAVIFILLSFGSKFLANAVGFIYPLYASFKALKTPDNRDDAMWLTYWVVYGLFTVVESGTDVLFYWIPFYNFVKIGVLVWLYSPTTRGAQKIYTNVINPFLSRHEIDVDSAINRGKNAASDFARQAQNEYSSHGKAT